MNAMDRLRAARPTTAEVALDRDTLFLDIVEQPGGRPRPAAARRGAPGRRTAVVLALALVAVLTLGAALATGGLLGWHTDHSIVNRPGRWQLLYRDATRSLTLPPGTRWPTRTLAPHTVTSSNQPGGEAVGIAQVSWECYWVRAIRRHDAAGARRAHAALNDIVRHHILVAPNGSPENVAPPPGVERPFAIFADDGGLAYVKRMYAQAAAGHPGLLDQSCRANGPGAPPASR